MLTACYWEEEEKRLQLQLRKTQQEQSILSYFYLPKPAKVFG